MSQEAMYRAAMEVARARFSQTFAPRPGWKPSPQAQHALDVQREWREAAERDRGK